MTTGLCPRGGESKPKLLKSSLPDGDYEQEPTKYCWTLGVGFGSSPRIIAARALVSSALLQVANDDDIDSKSGAPSEPSR